MPYKNWSRLTPAISTIQFKIADFGSKKEYKQTMSLMETLICS